MDFFSHGYHRITTTTKVARNDYDRDYHSLKRDDGCHLASEFYQAVVLGEHGLTLNINNSFCFFYQNYNLVQFLSCYLNNDIRKHGIPLNDYPLLVRKNIKISLVYNN
ncbi:unnamed protein product [Rotaria sp. Silwood1]|nr:unnamed protein product [Rotaria sp. Silwood1]